MGRQSRGYESFHHGARRHGPARGVLQSGEPAADSFQRWAGFAATARLNRRGMTFLRGEQMSAQGQSVELSPQFRLIECPSEVGLDAAMFPLTTEYANVWR